MDLENAYRLVFDDLANCPLFMGSYDAKNGSIDFMNGIGTVMETIALKASEEDYLQFNEKFFKNLKKSVDKIR